MWAPEAKSWPASNSALADYFSPAQLPIAVGIVAAAPFIGQGLANIAGGPLIDYLEATPNYVVPVVGELFSQMVLIIVGAPGLFVALLMWWLIEPERKTKSGMTISRFHCKFGPLLMSGGCSSFSFSRLSLPCDTGLVAVQLAG